MKYLVSAKCVENMCGGSVRFQKKCEINDSNIHERALTNSSNSKRNLK